MVDSFTSLNLMEFQVRYLALFPLFSVIEGFEWFWKESLHKNIQLIWCSSRLHPWSFFFLPYINDLPGKVIYNLAIYADDSTLYCKYDQASDL